jgi:hypothetical protein
VIFWYPRNYDFSVIKQRLSLYIWRVSFRSIRRRPFEWIVVVIVDKLRSFTSVSGGFLLDGLAVAGHHSTKGIGRSRS